jgi:DeoR family fructose operon transcriptional repressor
MLAQERHALILRTLEEQGFVTVTQLAEAFSVSTESVRRDLRHLESQKKLQRVHGGARRRSEFPEPAGEVSAGREQDRPDTQELCRTAMALIREGDMISVDAGGAAHCFAAMLRESFQQLTVVTHSYEVFSLLLGKPGFRLMLAGGEFLRQGSAFCGPLAEGFLRRIHIRKAFLFPYAVSLKNGFTEYISQLLPIQRAYMEQADQVIALAESSRFEKSALVQLCQPTGAVLLVSDSGLHGEYKTLYRERGLRVVTTSREAREAQEAQEALEALEIQAGEPEAAV